MKAPDNCFRQEWFYTRGQRSQSEYKKSAGKFASSNPTSRNCVANSGESSCSRFAAPANPSRVIWRVYGNGGAASFLAARKSCVNIVVARWVKMGSCSLGLYNSLAEAE